MYTTYPIIDPTTIPVKTGIGTEVAGAESATPPTKMHASRPSLKTIYWSLNVRDFVILCLGKGGWVLNGLR